MYRRFIHPLIIATTLVLGFGSSLHAQSRTLPENHIAPTRDKKGPIISGTRRPDLKIMEPYFILCFNDKCSPTPEITHLPDSGYCGPWDGGDMKIRLIVLNFSSIPAGASQVRIDYLYHGQGLFSVANVPALGHNEIHALEFDVPDGAWAPGLHSSLHFTIGADSAGHVAEMNEDNNTETSYCLGPAG